jgi:hypothetical protein
VEILPKCQGCNGEMHRETFAFIKCNNKKCYGSEFGFKHSEARPVRGVGHLLTKRNYDG